MFMIPFSQIKHSCWKKYHKFVKPSQTKPPKNISKFVLLTAKNKAANWLKEMSIQIASGQWSGKSPVPVSQWHKFGSQWPLVVTKCTSLGLHHIGVLISQCWALKALVSFGLDFTRVQEVSNEAQLWIKVKGPPRWFPNLLVLLLYKACTNTRSHMKAAANSPPDYLLAGSVWCIFNGQFICA